MNKVILLLSVACLVSVHAFVKRDAPNFKPQFLDDAKKAFQSGWEELKDKVDPDTLKKSLTGAVDSLNKAISEFKPSDALKA